MQSMFLGLIYTMFFLSGAAALMYQVIWVRSLTLIFGGSHLAVTTVLSVFMAGLASGGYLTGKHVDGLRKPLRLYGLIEMGIALFALIFMGLMKIYPIIYTFFAQGKDDYPLYLSFIRILFSVAALIVPATLMGGTLPVMTKFVSDQPDKLGRHLSFLYGFNTLGAVAGAAAGFFFLRLYSVTAAFQIAVAINILIGILSILLHSKKIPIFAELPGNFPAEPAANLNAVNPFQAKLILLGIGVSGFCALGYEVLWTKILTIVVGASVYGFTTMLIAFLAGIALGSAALGSLFKIFKAEDKGIRKTMSWFGMVQIVIGVTALLVTFYIRDLPVNSIVLYDYFTKMKIDIFESRQWANLLLAFIYMVIPAFFMGVAFPLAGKIHAGYKKMIGSAVGEVLAYNTVGAILGAAFSGFVIIYIIGIERSLQMLTIVNIGCGLLVLAGIKNVRLMNWTEAGIAAALLIIGINHDILRMWNMKYFAVFRANQPDAFNTPDKIKEALENTDVLYYKEGVEAIVSSIKIKGGNQAFLTNGRVEASDTPGDLQLQFTLGHLPMLLHRNPENVLVIGLGSGITLGATSVHPGVKEITLAELAPEVLGVARTFGRYNNYVLDNPKLRIIFNDGRNFLLTTKEKYDVITADPIHPWFRGAGYLYTTEYFKLASEHLREGGVMCQWLPIYELTIADLKSVVKTFTMYFKHTALWLTYYDSVIIGSNTPIVFDEAELERRISVPAVSNALKLVMMGSARDLLSYFAMGTDGMKAFSEGGTINTDNNLYLEFSAPLSIGKGFLMTNNLDAIVKHRESILPYLLPAKEQSARGKQFRPWKTYIEAAGVYDKAHILLLGEKFNAGFNYLLNELDRKYPWYAPGRFLKSEYSSLMAREPRLLKQTPPLVMMDERGAKVTIEISAVLSRISDEMAIVDFVDNNARVIYGHLNVPGLNRDEFINRFVDDVLSSIQKAYLKEARIAFDRGKRLPSLESMMFKIKEIVTSKIHESESRLVNSPS